MLASLLSSDKQERTQAEELYRSHLRDSPSVVLAQLADSLSEPVVAHCQLAGVLLRRALEDESDGCAWSALTPDEAFQVGSKVLTALQSDARGSRRAALAPMAQLTKLILEKSGQEWPQLFRAVFDLAVASSSERREAGFECFETIAEYSPSAVAPHAATIGDVLSRGLQDPDSAVVRLASIRAMSSLLVSLETDVSAFSPAIPLMLNAIRDALNQVAATPSAGLETASQKALSALVAVVERHPKLIKPHLYETATAMLAIVGVCFPPPRCVRVGKLTRGGDCRPINSIRTRAHSV